MAELQGQNAGSGESANKTSPGLTTTHKIICICVNLAVILVLYIIVNLFSTYSIFTCPILLTITVLVALLPVLTFFMSSEKCNKMICTCSFIVVLIMCIIIFLCSEQFVEFSLLTQSFSSTTQTQVA